MRLVKAVLGSVVMALVLVGFPAPALAQTTGPERITIVVRQDFAQDQPTFSRVVARGVVTAVGTDVFLSSPEGDPASYSRYEFPDGLKPAIAPARKHLRHMKMSVIATSSLRRSSGPNWSHRLGVLAASPAEQLRLAGIRRSVKVVGELAPAVADPDDRLQVREHNPGEGRMLGMRCHPLVGV
jgi:hypothetical protein